MVRSTRSGVLTPERVVGRRPALSPTAVRDDPDTSSHAWRGHTARFHSNLLTDATSRGWRRITLLDRRPGHRETMSDYLIRALRRAYSRSERDR
jgi:hypothetical protein